MINKNLNLYDIIDKNLSIKYNVVPKEAHENKYVFYAEEISSNVESSLKILLKRDIEFILCDGDRLNTLRDEVYSKEDLSSISGLVDDISRSEIAEIKTEDEDSKIVKFVNLLIEYAIENKASDIHLDNYEKYTLIRLRIDGILKDIYKLKKYTGGLVTNRIKVLSNLDYTVKNIPQDGRFTYKYKNKSIDIRVAITPTIYSGKVVLRILNREVVDFTREGIGLMGRQSQLVSRLITQPGGLILNVGPTGSGKTTTLITLLKELKAPEINIMTIEDPVEYRVEGLNQIEINEKRGLDFNLGLKSILRLDPDKIMVGEIRDLDTAKTALRASITGHLVMSTLHTNDSPSAIYRLRDMGVENYLISAGVIGVISQRLVRRLCDCKKEEYRYVDIYDEQMKIYSPSSCEKCSGGYRGRIAVYEVLVIDDFLREAIGKGVTLSEFRKLCSDRGMISLKESMRELLLKGETSLDEVYKNIVTIGEI
ncbi:MAG: GspE/PulE family protein [Peptoniphilus sp.]|nr:GspE/PulE family protein [Peptoniphilus sp.]